MTRALIAYYQGNARRSAELAACGQALTAIGSVVHAKLAAQEMRARAMLGDGPGMTQARTRAVAAHARLPGDIATTGAFSIPAADDPPYTATSLLLVGAYEDAVRATHRVIETVYQPRARQAVEQPTDYARSLLVLALAQVRAGRPAAASGTAPSHTGDAVWRPSVSDDELTAEQIAAITAAVDIQAPPPPEKPTAHLIFGTNQALPATLVAQRYHQGLAPVVIVTGGVNRHDGIVEGQQFVRLLTDAGVAADVIRCEDRSANTWQNVEFALPHLREALAAGLSLTAVSKWYHLRAVHVLRTFLPELDAFHALSWEPVYSGTAITRQNWPETGERRTKVTRERDEVARKVHDGTYRAARLLDGAWR